MLPFVERGMLDSLEFRKQVLIQMWGQMQCPPSGLTHSRVKSLTANHTENFYENNSPLYSHTLFIASFEHCSSTNFVASLPDIDAVSPFDSEFVDEVWGLSQKCRPVYGSYLQIHLPGQSMECKSDQYRSHRVQTHQ